MVSPTIDAAVKSRILKALEDLEHSIRWNGLSQAADLKNAIIDIKKDMDLGWEKTAALVPTSEDHHEWMDFAYLLTRIYNRDNVTKKYSVIRKVINIVHTLLVIILEEEVGFIAFHISLFGGGGRFVTVI